MTGDGVPQPLYKQVDRLSAELESRGAAEGIRELYMRTRNIQVGESFVSIVFIGSVLHLCLFENLCNIVG